MSELVFYEKCKECANLKTVYVTGNSFCKTNTFCTEKMPHFCYTMSTECPRFEKRSESNEAES